MMLNTRNIRDNQILNVADVVKLGNNEKNIRRAIHDELPLLWDSPALMLGFDLKQYDKELKKSSKQDCSEYNAFHCDCSKKPILIDLKDITEKKTGKTYRGKVQLILTAKCPRCGKKMVKFAIQTPVGVETNIITTTTMVEPKITKNRNIKKMVIRPAGENAKILYRFYYKYCLHIKGYTSATLSKIEKAVSHFITSSNNCDFKSVTLDTAIEFKEYLKGLTYRGEKISLSSVSEYLHYVQIMFIYLMDRPGFKKKINFELIECFNLSLKEANALKTGKGHTVKYPSYDVILEIVKSIGSATIVKRSKQAMISFLALSGVRRASLVKLRMCDWDPHESRLTLQLEYNNPKFGNYTEITVVPLNEQLFKIFSDYYSELVSLGYKDHDPIFPRSKPRKVGNDLCFVESVELSKEFMSKYNVSKIVKKICTEAGFPGYSAHKFRHSYTKAMKSRMPLMDLWVALMKNMGQKSLNLSGFHYGSMSWEEQHQIIMDHFSKKPDEIPDNVDPKRWKEFLKYVEFDEYKKNGDKNEKCK
ncbi:MAG: site-specific integrase [Candidatus Cloacimonetes bacterium]|jgi:integrase|nr:site-specific integrase [Candidatus Cloacimonadota bacterium]